ncbi:MAG: hypothetical protein AB8B88_01195 [Devosiaceae bacterium]
MTSPTQDDLFKAILAMDAYNRGYDRGLEIEGNNAQGDPDVGLGLRPACSLPYLEVGK